MAASPSDLRKRYEEKWNPAKYLDDYINTKNLWEERMVSSLHDLVENGKVNGPRGIDIGCGPTVHRMAILARACDEILACDFTPSNLEFVKKFLEDDEPAGPLSHSLQGVARLEGYKDLTIGEQALRERLRSKVKNVVRVDITSSESVNNLLNYGGQFDCAHCNGMLECACLTYESYVSALKNINSLLKPGGQFILGSYLKCTSYLLDEVKYECWPWDVDMVKKGLEEAGFKVDTLDLFQMTDVSYEGADVQDVCLSVSRKI